MNAFEIGAIALIGLAVLLLYMTVSRARQRERGDHDYQARDRLLAEIEADNVKAQARAEVKRFPVSD